MKTCFTAPALVGLLIAGCTASADYKWDLPDADPRPALTVSKVFPDGEHPDIYKEGWIDFNKNKKMDVFENPKADIKDRVEDLLSQMNVDEKTAQCCTLYGFNRVLKDPLPTPAWKKAIWKDGIANIDEHLNRLGIAEKWQQMPTHNDALNKVQQWFVEETRLGIPVDFSNEGIAGLKFPTSTSFPFQIGLGATFNKDLVRHVGDITGKEAKALGYSNVYSPILEVNRDQRWGRYEEAYGESPFLCSEMGLQQVLGIQTHRVASSPKHYTLYSIPKGARGFGVQSDPKIGPREAEMLLNWPFRTAFGEGKALGTMISYNDYDGIPVAGSRYFLTEKLRDDYNFRGYTVSDSSAVIKIWNTFHVAKDQKDAIRMYIMAGGNVKTDFRPPEIFINYLRELVHEGQVPMEVLDERVRDVLKVKFWMGLFDNPFVPDGSLAETIVSCQAHNKISLQASRECLTLLKNKNDLLPLDRKKIKSIALVGPNAGTTDWGKYRYGSSDPKVTSVREGLETLLGNQVKINYAEGCKLVTEGFPYDELDNLPLTPEEQKGIDEAVAAAEKSDVVVAVVGGCSGVTSGESRSRTSLNLTGRQLDLLKALHATGKPVVMVLITGRPLSINWGVDHLPAILLAWYPGAHGGTAIAEALFGDYNPGGKLPGTFPRTVGQVRMNFPFKPGTQPKAGGRVMAGVEGVLYSFGHGLSYTRFSYSNLKIDKEFITEDGKVTVSCDVTNTGKRAGDEVPQLYIRDVHSSISMYEKMLRGFERIHLEAGETKTVSFVIDPKKHLWLCNEAMKRVVEPGEFKLMIGASSEDIRLEGSFYVVASESEIEAMKKELSRGDLLTGVVTAASHVDTDKPTHVIDGDSETRWTCGDKKDAWLEMGLGQDRQVSEVSIQWYKGAERKYTFEIQVVNSIGSWDTIYKGESAGKKGGFETYTFPEATSNAIRIIGHGNNQNKYTSIEEIKIPGWTPNK